MPLDQIVRVVDDEAGEHQRRHAPVHRRRHFPRWHQHLDETVEDEDEEGRDQEGAEEAEVMASLGRPECVERQAEHQPER